MASSKDNVRIVVTGFGPFDGVPENPTTHLVNKLKNYLAPDLASITETALIETSAQASRSFIHSLLQQKEQNDDKSVILLHLGVNYKGTTFQLERCAYNDASFRVPDEQGFQPKGESILGEAVPVGATLQTQIDVEKLASQLNADVKKDVLVSTDPGRFVCNYTYCYSLQTFQESSSSSSNYRCLFLHVPPFSEIPEEDQLAFVERLLELLYERQEQQQQVRA